MQTMSDRQLQMLWIGRRDADAFAGLVHRHASMVFSVCKRVTGSAVDAEDIAQECFLTLSQQERVIAPSLAGWLHRVAVHTSLNRIRAERRRVSREQRYTEQQQLANSSKWDEIRPVIDEEVSRLPEPLKEVIVRRFFEGETHEAIGESLGIGRTTVQYRIKKGTELVRKALRRRGIVSSATVLSAFLMEQAAEAAPASLIASLGSYAVGGLPTAPGLATQKLLIGGTIVSKKVVLTTSVVLALLLLTLAGLLGSHEFRTRATFDSEVDTAVAAHETPSRSTANPEISRASAVGPKSDLEPDKTLSQPGMHAPEVIPVALPPLEALANPASVSGTVLDDAAIAVSGATVYVEVRRQYGLISDGTLTAYSAVTDANGYYTITGISNTSSGILLAATAPGYAGAYRHIASLHAGEQREGVDLTMGRVAHSIRGKVVTGSGSPVPRARLVAFNIGYTNLGETLMMWGSNTFGLAYSDERGEFELSVGREGRCDVLVSKNGYGEKPFFGIETGTTNVELMLTGEIGSIEGHVTYPGGRPASSQVIYAKSEIPAGGIQPAVGLSEPARYPAGELATRADANGYYRFEACATDHVYTISALSTDAWAAALEGSSSSQKPLAVRGNVVVQAGAPTTVDLVLNPAATISGVVRDAGSRKPIASSVVVGSVDGRPGFSVQTDKEGVYRAEVLLQEPTQITVSAQYVNPNGTCEATGGTNPLIAEIAPGSKNQLDINVDAPISIPVRVVDGLGDPMPGLSIGVGHVREDQGYNHTWTDSGTTDQDGRCLLGSYPFGATYFVWAMRREETPTGYTDGFSKLILAKSGPIVGRAPGETLSQVTLVVERRGGVEGVLLDGNGVPVRGAYVTLSAVSSGGHALTEYAGRTDSGGSFALVRAFPPDTYVSLTVSASAGDESMRLETRLSNVEVLEDAVTNLGNLTVLPQQKEP